MFIIQHCCNFRYCKFPAEDSTRIEWSKILTQAKSKATKYYIMEYSYRGCSAPTCESKIIKFILKVCIMTCDSRTIKFILKVYIIQVWYAHLLHKLLLLAEIQLVTSNSSLTTVNSLSKLSCKHVHVWVMWLCVAMATMWPVHPALYWQLRREWL